MIRPGVRLRPPSASQAPAIGAADVDAPRRGAAMRLLSATCAARHAGRGARSSGRCISADIVAALSTARSRATNAILSHFSAPPFAFYTARGARGSHDTFSILGFDKAGRRLLCLLVSSVCSATCRATFSHRSMSPFRQDEAKTFHSLLHVFFHACSLACTAAKACRKAHLSFMPKKATSRLRHEPIARRHLF